jgi:polyisoprenoid-binding protein YceI
MKRAILFLAAFIFIPALLVAENDTNDKKDATPWTIDTSHSAINFSIRHFFTPVDGLFDEYDAEVYFDPANLEGSSISVTIPVTSINTRNERRDGHLQSEDFFNAETWPSMQFVSSEVVAGEGENELRKVN